MLQNAPNCTIQKTDNTTKVYQHHNYNEVFYPSYMYCGQTYCSMRSSSTSVLHTFPASKTHPPRSMLLIPAIAESKSSSLVYCTNPLPLQCNVLYTHISNSNSYVYFRHKSTYTYTYIYVSVIYMIKKKIIIYIYILLSNSFKNISFKMGSVGKIQALLIGTKNF